MLMDSVLILVALCHLCGRPVNARMLPEQELESSDVQKRKTENSSLLEVPVTPDSILKDSAQSFKSWPIRIPLSMSPDSVDDMYYGCSHKMLIKVKQHYLPRSTREGLHTSHTKLCAARAMKMKDSDDELSWNHFRALCAYTAGSYDDLNQAVRREKSSYQTSFQFHALHFLLSDSIRLLKLNQRSCLTSYRRSRLLFSGELGQIMRFGSFASSSLNKNLRQFGQRTCFEIRTCFGAYLKSYTEFDSDEDEVLIPPYEMFTIVSVDTSGNNELQCDVFYRLETAGVYSSVNCQDVNV